MGVLNVTLSGGSGSSQATYNLQAENAIISYDKSATAIPMPGGANPQFIDVGAFSTNIAIFGIIDETSSYDGGVIVPSKENLEDKITAWYATNITITINGDVYYGRIKNARFEISGAKEHFWVYNIVFLTTKRV